MQPARGAQGETNKMLELDARNNTKASQKIEYRVLTEAANEEELVSQHQRRDVNDQHDVEVKNEIILY